MISSDTVASNVPEKNFVKFVSPSNQFNKNLQLSLKYSSNNNKS